MGGKWGEMAGDNNWRGGGQEGRRTVCESRVRGGRWTINIQSGAVGPIGRFDSRVRPEPCSPHLNLYPHFMPNYASTVPPRHARQRPEPQVRRQQVSQRRPRASRHQRAQEKECRRPGRLPRQTRKLHRDSRGDWCVCPAPSPVLPLLTACPVTNLEAVVLQLQESCKTAKQESTELRSENHRLRNEARDREKFWRALWTARRTGMPPDPSDEASLPSYAQLHHSSPTATPNRMASVSPTIVGPYDPRLRYPTDSSPSLVQNPYQGATSTDFVQRSPAMGFAPVNTSIQVPGRPSSVDPPRISPYNPYPPYATDGSSPNDTWSQQGIPTPSGEQPPIDGSQSPTYVESPSLTSSELSYTSHYGVTGEEQKVPLNGMHSAPYMYPASRSISPSSTPTSTSSTSLAPAPFQFTFPDVNMLQDRPEFSRRPHNPYFAARGPELTLHGGTADIPIAGSVGDALRYRLTHANTMPPMPYSRTENNSGEGVSDDSETHTKNGRARARRSTAPSVVPSRTSRSPSPAPPISGTLAVIKAQAFGALRRTRGRSRRSSEGAAKAAVDALSARGLGLGVNLGPAAKRPRLKNDHNDDTLT